MASVEDHYQNLLAGHYTWMSGGHAAKVPECVDFFQRHGVVPRGSGKALDLGCGSGFQSLALAALDFDVLSIDTSTVLLDELRAQAGGKLVTAMRGDMRNAELYAAHAPFEAVVCMGDSLTLLDSIGEAEALLKAAHGSLEPGGRLALSFRDLSAERKGADRILPVRADADKIMTVFLEYEAERVNVHDLVYVRETVRPGRPHHDEWVLQKSVYRKLRLNAARVVEYMRGVGFQDVTHEMERGFATIVARC